MIIINICRWFFIGLYNIVTIVPKYLLVGFMCVVDPQKGKMLKYKGKPIIPITMIGLTLATYFICIFLSTRWYVQRLKINYLNNDIIESTRIIEEQEPPLEKKEETEVTQPVENDQYTNVSYISTDLNELKSRNSDVVGWIKINNTNVNYPIVQTTDNEFYLKHDIYKYYNINGSIYGDYRDDFINFGNNTILYGHNMTNRTMFGSLVWCLRRAWQSNPDNQYIKLSTLNSNTVWKIFSIYQIPPEIYYLKTYFDDDNDYQQFLNTLTTRSEYQYGETLTPNDKIITLSTCTDDGSKRIVIHAKMIKYEAR